jgi:hypothetical protein
VSTSPATPHAGIPIVAEEALAEPGDESVAAADEDELEDSGPAGTGEPLAHAVAPEELELQTLAPIVERSCSVPACDSPCEPPARPIAQSVAAPALVAATSEATKSKVIARGIRLAITLPPISVRSD